MSKRIQHDLQQGTSQWHAFRAEHDGASEAPAMLGLSKYKTRNDLLRDKFAGCTDDVNAATQRLFDAGHAAEAAARPLAEHILADELYPATYSYGRLSASTDGLTMGCETAFEHKLYRQDLAESVKRFDLPDEYQAQCQQIMLVTGAERVLFVTSDGTDANWAHMFVEPDPAWQTRIVAGWAQFHADLAAYQPVEVLPAAVAAPTMQLPALSIQVTGSIKLVDNLAVFGAGLKEFIAKIPSKPSTEQEFADCKEACKRLQEAQDRLEGAKASGLAQVATVDEMVRTVDLYAELARTTRLAVEKMVAAREQQIKVEIVQKAKAIYEEHVASLTKETGGPWICIAPPDFAGAIKGKRNIPSLQNAVDTALANGKIAADASAKRIRENLSCIKADGAGYDFLFADSLALISKPIDDLRMLIKVRISDHKEKEAKRLDGEREKIRAEEQAKAAREQQAEAMRLAREQIEKERKETALQQLERDKEQAAAQVPAQGPIPEPRGIPHSPPAPAACLHDVIQTWRTDDGIPQMWACAECRLRFYPASQA